jgi:hypothetical protein
VLFRLLNGVMAALFALAVAVQYNDPDPLRWMAIYGLACGAAAVRAAGRSVPLAFVLAVGVIALAWGSAVAGNGPVRQVYRHMFDAWEMASLPVEEAREASGLFIVALWMGVLTVSEWRSRKSRTRGSLA